MKTFKKSFALVLTLIVLMLSLPFASVSAQSVDPDFNYGQKILSQRANSESLLKLYNYFIESWETMGKVNYPLDLKLEDGDYWLVAEMAYADHPEYFWAIHATAPMYYNFDEVGGLEVAKEQFDRITADLTQGLEGKSDYQKAKILHNRLCKTVTYEFSDYHQTTYGALVQGISVCNGYARAYQHLLKSVGIPAWFVTGTANGGGHAWNMVKLDGKWYYTDTTWDDIDIPALGEYDYRYFNITYEQISQDHVLDELFAELVPEANSTDASYSVAEKLIFDEFDFNRLATAIANDEDHRVELTVNGDTQKFVDKFYENEAAIAQYLNATDYDSRVLWEYKHGELIGIIIDFDITVECTHTYSDVCDTTCNKCWSVRKVSDHNYSHACDASCELCGKLRVFSHTYDGIADDKCNSCDQVRDTKTWQISVDETDAYEINPRIIIDGFSASDITVYDSKGNVVEYNHGYNGFLLKKGETYTVRFNVNYSDYYGDFDIYASKICSYHIFDNTLDTTCDNCGFIREITGDVNGDTDINNRDLALLMQYVNDWDVTVDETAADVNVDGEINNRDLALLMQRINGWNV